MRQRCLQAGRTKPHRWTEADDEFLREFAPGHLIDEIQEEWTRRFGTEPPTASAIQNRKRKLGVKSGIRAGCFTKGFTPWNKGKSWDEQGRSEESRRASAATQFKPGNRPHNSLDKPVGYERVDAKDGYVWVKVKNGQQEQANDNFRPKHHLVFEKEHGRPVADGHMIVFADHNRLNCDPDNLVEVPRKLIGIINREGIQYMDKATLEMAVDIAKARHAIHSARCRPRRCRACGNSFNPRYPNQRTCDECLDNHHAAQNRT